MFMRILPRKLTWPLKHDSWKSTFLLKWSLFRGYVWLCKFLGEKLLLVCSTWLSWKFISASPGWLVQVQRRRCVAFFGEYFGGLVRFGYSTNPNEHQCTNIRGKYTTFAYSMFFYTSSIHIGLNMMVHRSQAVFRWKVRKRQVALGPRLFPNDRLRSWESASVSCGGSKKWRNPHTILFCLQIWCSTCVFGNMYACGHIYM